MEPERHAGGNPIQGGLRSTPRSLPRRQSRRRMTWRLFAGRAQDAALTASVDTASYHEFRRPVLSRAFMSMAGTSTRRRETRNNPDVSPSRAGKVELKPSSGRHSSSLQRAYPLRDEGQAYARKLHDGGSPRGLLLQRHDPRLRRPHCFGIHPRRRAQSGWPVTAFEKHIRHPTGGSQSTWMASERTVR